MPTPTRTETLIIGAGPAGLALAACLRQAGREFLILERASAVGSAWLNHYERLHLHTARGFSGLPFQPFGRDLPKYVPRVQVASYLDDYARAFELAPRFGEAVTRAQPTAAGFRVETAQSVYESRFLVVASGYNRLPIRPSFTGEAHCSATIVHSSEYRSGASYRGKRVLVVGGGNTGAELALDLCEQGAAAIDLCVRGPIHVVPREVLGVPSQLLAILTAWLPRPVRDVLFQALVAIVVGDLSRFGIRRPREGILAQIARVGRIPIMDIGCVAQIRRGRVRVRPDIRELTASGALFADGTSGDYDAIVLATGFRPALDAYLRGCSEALDERGYPREHGRETQVPGLYFVGFNNVVTGLLREIGREAKQVAADIAERPRPEPQTLPARSLRAEPN